MKTFFTKIFLGNLVMICLLLNSNLIFAQAQWVSSNNFSALNAATYNETLKVTSTGGSVGGGNVVRGDAINSTGDILEPAGYGEFQMPLILYQRLNYLKPLQENLLLSL